MSHKSWQTFLYSWWIFKLPRNDFASELFAASNPFENFKNFWTWVFESSINLEFWGTRTASQKPAILYGVCSYVMVRSFRPEKLKLIREFLRPSPSAFSGKKIQNHHWWRHSLDLGSESYMCRKSVSWAILWCQFQMAYANMCGNMPCWTEINTICWDRHQARLPEKNSKTWEHIQNDATLRSGFFPQNALSDGPAFWIFFQDSRIRVKIFYKKTKLYLIQQEF